MTIIEIRPFRNGWQVYEGRGVQPVFLDQEQAISYAAPARVVFGVPHLPKLRPLRRECMKGENHETFSIYASPRDSLDR
jgi:hypothetical protein